MAKTKKTKKISEVENEVRETKTESEKKKKKNIKIPWLLVIVAALIAVPAIIFGGILLSAQADTGTPQIADRFEGQLTNELTSEDMEVIKTDISALENVDEVTVEFKVATVRVYMDTVDTLDSKAVASVQKAAYDAINAKYPIADYFTTKDGISEYDLEIYTYTTTDTEADPARIIYRLVKNSPQANYLQENVGVAKDQDLVNDLYASEEARKAEEAAAAEAEANGDTTEGDTTDGESTTDGETTAE